MLVDFKFSMITQRVHIADSELGIIFATSYTPERLDCLSVAASRRTRRNVLS